MSDTIFTINTELVDDFVLYLTVDRDLRQGTISQHKSNLSILSKYMQEKDCAFDFLAMRQFIAQYKKTKDPGTLQGYVYTIRVFCEYLISQGIIDDNFGKDIPLPRRMRKLPDILSVEEIEALLSVPMKYHYESNRRKWDTLFHLLAKTGCRIGEALESKPKHFDLKKGEWRIEGKKLTGTKTGMWRLVPLAPDLIDKIGTISRDRKPEDYIFASDKAKAIGRDGLPLSAGAVREELRKRAKAANLHKRITPHIFRHAFITELFRQNISILKIAMICGHEEIGTTQRYAKLVTDDLRTAILYHPLVAKDQSPKDVLAHVVETLNGLKLTHDPRFDVEMTEGSDSVKYSVSMRKNKQGQS